MRGRAHSEETRAAVMAALLSGQGVNEVAKKFKLDSGMVSRWKKAIPQEQLQQVAVEKGEQIEQLLFGYLTTLLGALTRQAEVFSEPDYLKKQPADSNAVLHGVMADKAVRLLEAVAAANAQSNEPGEAESL